MSQFGNWLSPVRYFGTAGGSSSRNRWSFPSCAGVLLSWKTVLQNHILRFVALLFVEIDGENSKSKFVLEHGQAGGQKWPRVSGDEDAAGITCQRSRIRGCGMNDGMVLISSGRNMFTTAGRLRSDPGWPWTFRIARVTVLDGLVAPLTSQTLTRAIFSLSAWPSSCSYGACANTSTSWRSSTRHGEPRTRIQKPREKLWMASKLAGTFLPFTDTENHFLSTFD